MRRPRGCVSFCRDGKAPSGDLFARLRSSINQLQEHRVITLSAFADEIGPDLDLQMDTCEAHDIRCIDVRGIDGVNCGEMSLEQVAGYRRRLDDRGFRVPCLGTPIGKIGIDDDFDAHLDLLKHCVDVARGFGTDRLRIFSFYPPEGGDILAHRGEVLDRMGQMVEVAERMDAVLLHENEKAIYGAKPAGVVDLLTAIGSDRLGGIFDPANFVEEGVRPYDEGWLEGLADLTVYFHIKDKQPGKEACVPAGEGQGQFDELFADLNSRGYSGTMTLEPHLAAAGQFAGFTGPDLFAKAVRAVKARCDRHGLSYAVE